MIDQGFLQGCVGATASMDFTVAPENTAAAVGSGVVPVLGTPVMIAWLEAVTLQQPEMPQGSASVGVHVDIAHLAASPVGTPVTCTSRLRSVDGLRLSFSVEARDAAGALVATGTIDRVVVDLERFLARV